MEAAGWQQYHRIPAFGDWNYNNNNYPGGDAGAGGVDDDHWPPVTPCFDFMRTAVRPAAQQKSCKRSTTITMPNARRMRIPAFGEWNHHGGGSDDCDGIGIGIGNGGNGTWPAAAMTPFFDLATPQKAPKTGRWRGGDGFDAANKLATAAEAPAQGHIQTKRSKVADSGAYAAAAGAARRSCFTAAKPVDDDLYGVPPDMLYGKPPGPRKAGRLILRLLGCSCSCFSPSS